MARFLDTSNDASCQIRICMRCNQKRRWDEIVPDGNSPGLMVCKKEVKSGCRDNFDPYRLPPWQPDRITNLFSNPDVPLIVPFVPPDDPTPPEPPPNPDPTPPQ